MMAEVPRPDQAPIPIGEYCYRVIWNAGREPQGPREVWFHRSHGSIAVRCPYWRRTDQATVCCDYLGVEHADEAAHEWMERLASRFGSLVEAMKHIERSLLYDEIKICAIHVEDDDPTAM